MKVEIVTRERSFLYRIALDSTDRTLSRRGFADARFPFTLVGLEYRVEVPHSFRSLHPDLHAAAIWLVLKPLIGSRLELPFAVSEPWAAAMMTRHGVEVPRCDSSIRPRGETIAQRPCLLLSGGMDSVAAAAVFPVACDHLFLDRIVHPATSPDPDALIDLENQRGACDAVAAAGGTVHRIADDHERLFEPYPMWHSDMAPLSALYMADSLGVTIVDSGEVLDACYFGGYQGTAPSSWKFRKPGFDGGTQPERPWSSLGPIMLSRAESINGLSEVATSRIVSRSPFRDKSYSCYYRSDQPFCMRCDKCFKKLLLRHIADAAPVPTELFEHFLAVPRLSSIFDRPFFDWHHVWFYLFQNLQCDHWYARELHEQALAGPDLSMLAKWYPGSHDLMAPMYRDAIVENIARYVPTMSAAEVESLESLDVPPLHAPRRRVMVAAGDVQPSSDPASVFAESLLRLLATVLTVGPAPAWSDVQVVDLRVESGKPRVLVHLRARDGGEADADQLMLTVERIKDQPGGFYAKVAGLGIRHLASTPIDLPWRKLAVDALAKHLAAVASLSGRRRS